VGSSSLVSREALYGPLKKSKNPPSGSDSAPHPVEAKKTKPAAGCFTQMYATQIVVAAVEEGLRLGWIKDEEETVIEALTDFLRHRGRRFYQLKDSTDQIHEGSIILEKKGERIRDNVKNESGTIEVIPFRAGEETWSLRWK
jgi:dihydroorotase